VPLHKILDYEETLQAFMRTSHTALLHLINQAGDYNADIEKSIQKALEEFVASKPLVLHS